MVSARKQKEKAQPDGKSHDSEEAPSVDMQCWPLVTWRLTSFPIQFQEMNLENQEIFP